MGDVYCYRCKKCKYCPDPAGGYARCKAPNGPTGMVELGVYLCASFKEKDTLSQEEIKNLDTPG